MAERLQVGNAAASSNKIISTYYSGTDVRVYFGDVWVDEIVEVNFSLQEQVAPIYGYGSYTYDAAARGNRIVVGEFIVNFKEVGYLQMILDGLSSDMNNKNEWFSLEEFKSDVIVSGKNVGKHYNLPPETVIENFNSLAEQLEDSIWGKSNDLSAFTNERTKDSYFYGSRTKYNGLLKRHGFNVLITYGGACQDGRYSDSFRTVQSIVGVQLTGLSQRVDPSGNPIQEVYSFIAKDITGNVTKPV